MSIWISLCVWSSNDLFSTVGTIVVTEWRTKYRREMNLLANEKHSKAVDSLINFETVKYYGNADYEVDRFDNSITNYQVH